MRDPDRPSYWDTTADVDSSAAGAVEPIPLVGTTRTEVAVVGAGITGLVIAAALAERGREVVVIEARDVAAGTTGGSTAKVTALHGLTYDALAARRGAHTARGYGEANLWAVDELERLVHRHSIDCGWEQQPAYTYTTDDTQVDSIRREAQAAASAGLPASLVTETPLPFRVAAAVRCEAQAQLDPRRFCVGLARALRSAGVEVHRRAPVRAVHEGAPHMLELDEARIEADSIVLATQLPVHDPGLFFSRTTPVRSYALAARLDGPVPDGMFLGTGSSTRSIRHVGGEPDVGVFGGPSHQTGEGGDTTGHLAELEDWVRSEFPVLEVLARWSAQDRMPDDGVPFIGRMPMSAEGVYVATGFKKWGLTSSAVAARVVADLMDGHVGAWLEVFDAGRAPGSVQAVRSDVEANAKVVGHFVGDRVRSMRPPGPDDLEPGEGGIVEVDGTKVAAYRQPDGRLISVSARCPHMGCLVAWNRAERSWDCPCHGSRFATDGTVLDGPATVPLPDPQPLDTG